MRIIWFAPLLLGLVPACVCGKSEDVPKGAAQPQPAMTNVPPSQRKPARLRREHTLVVPENWQPIKPNPEDPDAEAHD
jgi:hypothetical protein